MKKTVLILIGFLFLAFQIEKEFTLKFNERKLNNLWNALEKSKAPHDEVKELQDDIQNQLKSQLPKPPIDSSKVKK